MSDDHRPSRPTTSTTAGVYSRSWTLTTAYRRVDEMQARARLRRILGDPALTTRRPLYVIAGLLIVAAIVLSYSLLLVAGLLVLAIAAVPEVWYLYGMRALTFRRAPTVSRTSFGSVVEAPLVIENRSALPLPFVETQDNFPDGVPTLGMSLDISALPERAELVQTMGLWAFQRMRRRFYIRAAQRGVFVFGPTTIKVTDPFGIITREETLATERALIVHPLIAPLDRFGLAPQSPFGDRASRARLLEDPLRVSGVRQYMPGDDPRRIHWKATARTGEPQSKILDPSTQRTLMIALDVRTFTSVQMGYDPDLSELAISAAASVATWAFEEGYAVGALSNGSLCNLIADGGAVSDGRLSASEELPAGAAPRLHIAPSARRESLTAILDGFARLLPYNGGSLASYLVTERRTLPVGASLVYIGLDALVDVPTIIALRELRARGLDVTLLLTSREADTAEGDDEAPRNLHLGMLKTHYVGGRAKWQELLSEGLGDLKSRRASAPLTPDQLRKERELIAQRRRLRQRAQALGAEAEEADSADAEPHRVDEERHHASAAT